MATSPLFSSARKQLVATLLIAAGSTALVACKSQEAAYRPAPVYSKPATTYTQPAPTYTQPSAPTYTPPPAAPTQKPGAVACGNGKCA